MRALVVMALVVLMAVPCFAGQVSKEIIDETLSISNPVAEEDLNIQGAEKVTFFATLDNNRTTAVVTATVTAAYSVNGTDWTDISWMDVGGGVTPQTTETTTLAQQTYVGWIHPTLMAKYIRIRVKAAELESNTAGYTALDNATLSVTIIQDR